MENCKVIFYPDKKEVTVQKGTDLLSAASKAGVYIYNICGGEGVCGKCKVKVIEGDVRSESTRGLTQKDKKHGYTLACRAAVYSDAKVEVLPESRIEHPSILMEEIYTPAEAVEKPAVIAQEKIFAHGPLASKHYLELPLPSLEDNVSDLDRLYREIRKIHPAPVMQMGLANVRKLGKLLRQSEWKLTVTLGKRNGTIEVVLIEPGDTTAKNFGIALDIGTTTIVAYLVDLNTEQIKARRASYNRQVSFGEDVITRIVYSQEPG
ncbi:MAG: 2Fe-2S iron-sulfur cluster-binding protein, partial [Candidatus Omnitrophota bacterium]